VTQVYIQASSHISYVFYHMRVTILNQVTSTLRIRLLLASSLHTLPQDRYFSRKGCTHGFKAVAILCHIKNTLLRRSTPLASCHYTLVHDRYLFGNKCISGFNLLTILHHMEDTFVVLYKQLVSSKQPRSPTIL